MRAIGSMNKVRAGLLLRGWRSVPHWADAHGFKPGTVRRAIYDWGERDDKEPLGGIKRQIIAALRDELEKPVGEEA